MKYHKPDVRSEGEVQAEFYRRCRNADIEIHLEYSPSKSLCRLDAVIVRNGTIVAIIECKRGETRGKHDAKRENSQRQRYGSFGVPVIWIRGFEQLEKGFAEVKRIIAARSGGGWDQPKKSGTDGFTPSNFGHERGSNSATAHNQNRAHDHLAAKPSRVRAPEVEERPRAHQETTMLAVKSDEELTLICRTAIHGGSKVCPIAKLARRGKVDPETYYRHRRIEIAVIEAKMASDGYTNEQLAREDMERWRRHQRASV